METPERIAKLETQVEGMKEDVTELKGDISDLHSRISTGNREIVDKLESMEIKLDSRMKERADTSLKEHIDMTKCFKDEICKVTKRLNILERWHWIVIGGAVVIGYLISNLDLFKFVK